jgi:hypothetical protein
MKEGGRACPGVRDSSFPGLPADSALAKWLGDYHATPGTQDGPLHISLRRPQARLLKLL